MSITDKLEGVLKSSLQENNEYDIEACKMSEKKKNKTRSFGRAILNICGSFLMLSSTIGFLICFASFFILYYKNTYSLVVISNTTNIALYYTVIFFFLAVFCYILGVCVFTMNYVRHLKLFVLFVMFLLLLIVILSIEYNDLNPEVFKYIFG